MRELEHNHLAEDDGNLPLHQLRDGGLARARLAYKGNELAGVHLALVSSYSLSQ